MFAIDSGCFFSQHSQLGLPEGRVTSLSLARRAPAKLREELDPWTQLSHLRNLSDSM